MQPPPNLDPIYRSDIDVQLIDHLGDDETIVRAARVSTQNDSLEPIPEKETAGLINFLMRERHGSPFEHVVFQFRIECPIFVAREVMRHRMASYNEASARYSVLPTEFYVTPDKRNLVQVGKAGQYTFEPGSGRQIQQAAGWQREIAAHATVAYHQMLAEGIAREVARNVLPVSTYTRFYMTLNLRSVMNFLSLRTQHDEAAHPSYPLYEIALLGERMEQLVGEHVPHALTAFTNHGRVAP